MFLTRKQEQKTEESKHERHAGQALHLTVATVRRDVAGTLGAEIVEQSSGKRVSGA